MSGYNALHEQENEIIQKICSFINEYRDSLPFRAGDCVRVNSADRCVKKCWIVRIEIREWDPAHVNLYINRPQKDGTRSKRMECEYCVKISDVEFINDEPC